MAKSEFVQRLDGVQARLAAVLKPLRLTKRGRFFNREVEPGLVQVIGLQAGRFEIGPPLPAPVEHWRPDHYGQFTVNLGVYIEEAYLRDNPARRSNATGDHDCAVRVRLSTLADDEDKWWRLEDDPTETADDIAVMALAVGIPFLDRFATRNAVVARWVDYNERERRLSNVARLDVAMVLLARGDRVTARRLFEEQIASSKLPGHTQYVRDKAISLGLFG